MNKYILSKRNIIIKLNTDTLDVDFVENSYDIDRVWFVEEDGIFVRENKEYEVKKGDIVLFMYRIGNEKEGDLIIINNSYLNNYFERKKKFIEEMKKQKCTEKVCSDCDLKCECTPNY